MPDEVKKPNDNDVKNQNGDDGSQEICNIHANATIPRMPMPKLIDNLHAVRIYFTSLEFWFEASNVTVDNKKYCSVMAQIPLDDLSAIQTEISPVPVGGKYDHIKPIIIAFYSDSQQKRFHEAINEVQLGDSKPSKFYQQLKNLASDSLTATALVDLWAARLPEMAHAAVIQMRNSPIKDRLAAADALVESIRLRTIGDRNIHQATAQPLLRTEKLTTTPAASAEINVLEQLSNQIAKLERSFNINRAGDKSFNVSRPRERSKSRADHPNCWYHWKFGAEAKHCRMPCKFETTDITKSYHN